MRSKLGNEEERVDAWEKAMYSSTGNEGSGNLRALMIRSISNSSNTYMSGSKPRLVKRDL